ncbi:MAG: response regulator transcription factor [Alphaproteobacteria bacterium]|nr:response regulator transcription factor [Alphaproteobacteria bacterium]MDE1985197.1 response regulator transcription factor [Alphaproteobacteria bacterium]MDE2162536.1 response regulator transcription factor [Alphaproteobacteria bacterium]MDE2265888.1 response regulator transcription factor [Alphaproteobacteria bacterium]MDE2499274.1 response regulator transcription factor [Alphaproteobacteria bacterium]
MNILLVEDDSDLAAYILRGLAESGHNVDHAARGDGGFELASKGHYDLLIVDRMLPGMDGLSLVKALREKESRLPVLFLSNLGGLDDRVEGLNSGGDDYLSKPFAFTELLARVNALLRRPHLAGQPTTIHVGELEMDLIKRRVTRAGREIDLQPREFALLEYLMRRPDQIATRTMLLEGVWDYHFDPKTNIVETHISRLRSKIGGDIIQTIRGSGYLIRAARTAS